MKSSGISTWVIVPWLTLLASALTGCASQPIGTHQPSLDNVQILKQSNVGDIALGRFELGSGVPAKVDKLVTLRGSRITSPTNDSYAQYVKESLTIELKTAGKYDPDASCVLSGELLRNELNAAGASKGNAALAATFSVTRDGRVVYSRRHDVEHTWPSSFIGAIAIPEAINQYTEMYTRLLRKLFEDAEFLVATREGQ